MTRKFCALPTLLVLGLFVVGIRGESEGEAGARFALQWRCYRLPRSVPCLKDDSSNHRSWFYDVTTASCRVNPTSSCDVTDRVGNDFHTLKECIKTCMPGGVTADELKNRSSSVPTSTTQPTAADDSKLKQDDVSTTSTEQSDAASAQEEGLSISIHAMPGDVVNPADRDVEVSIQASPDVEASSVADVKIQPMTVQSVPDDVPSSVDISVKVTEQAGPDIELASLADNDNEVPPINGLVPSDDLASPADSNVKVSIQTDPDVKASSNVDDERVPPITAQMIPDDVGSSVIGETTRNVSNFGDDFEATRKHDEDDVEISQNEDDKRVLFLTPPRADDDVIDDAVNDVVDDVVDDSVSTGDANRDQEIVLSGKDNDDENLPTVTPPTPSTLNPMSSIVEHSTGISIEMPTNEHPENPADGAVLDRASWQGQHGDGAMTIDGHAAFNLFDHIVSNRSSISDENTESISKLLDRNRTQSTEDETWSRGSEKLVTTGPDSEQPEASIVALASSAISAHPDNDDKASEPKSTPRTQRISFNSNEHLRYNPNLNAATKTAKPKPDIVTEYELSAQDDMHAAAKAHEAAMRTITIMLPVRYNEAPPPPVHDHAMMPPSSVEAAGPSHGPLNGQLLGALPQEPPFIVSRWSASFDIPPPGVDSGPSVSSGTAQDKSTKHSTSSTSLSPGGFLFNLLTGARYQPPPPAQTPAWANEIQRQQRGIKSPARPEVQWRPPQLLQRYVELHRGEGSQPPGAVRSDGGPAVKNDVVMTAIAYGLLGRGEPRKDSATPSITSTTTPSTKNVSRRRKFSAGSEYRQRAPGRYRSYAHPDRRRIPIRRVSNLDLTFDSDVDDDDEVLEALFGYDRSPMSLRRFRRPSSSQASAHRVYGRRRLGEDRRRRWRPRGEVHAGKLLRRTGGRATPGGDREKPAARSRRPQTVKPTKSDVGLPDTDSRRRLSLLHIVVSRQQDFAAPQPAMKLAADRPGLQPLEPRPLDVDALHSLSRHPFIRPFSSFLPAKPIISDRHLHHLQDSDDKEMQLRRDEAKTDKDDDLTNNICFQPVDIGNCKSYQNKWYFNHKVGRCDMFFYGGCGGNGNRFETLEHCLRACAHTWPGGDEKVQLDGDDKKDDEMPPGAADSWTLVGDNDDEEQTTSKPTDVIIVTSPVYVPMSRYDVESAAVTSRLTDDVDSTKAPLAAATGPITVDARHQQLDSTTPHGAIAPTLPVHGDNEAATAEDTAALILGLPQPYVIIIIVLGIVSLAVITLVTVIVLHMCCKVRKSKKAEILEAVVKAHSYDDEVNKVVYSEPPTIKLNEKL